MLKRITLIAAAVLAVTLIAGIILVPMAIRDTIKNGDAILKEWIKSSPVSTFDGTPYTAINIDLADGRLIVEQSPDDKIYIRTETFLVDPLEIETSEQTVENAKTLSITFGQSDLFMNPSATPYMAHKIFNNSSSTVILLRIPASLAIHVTSSPWAVEYQQDVQFANRTYYDHREWQQDRDNQPTYQDTRGFTREKCDVMINSFKMELETTVARRYSEENPSLASLDTDIDKIQRVHSARMKQELLIRRSNLYSIDTLATLLDNYLTLEGQTYKQRARQHLGSELPEEEVQERLSNVQDLASTSANRFMNMYENYLADLETIPNDDSADLTSSAKSQELELRPDIPEQLPASSAPEQESSSTQAPLSSVGNELTLGNSDANSNASRPQ